MDPEALGLKAGLEIHQQLEAHKLFCACPSTLREEPGLTFRRRLRPTQSELGEVDAAAVEEAKRALAFVYETAGTCLVEADEEPPHEANREAIETAILFALLVGARVLDEIHFMRKIVIDGSNTTGFQRSALIATDGRLEIDGRVFGIPTILVEEDAARKVGERAGEVVYRLDRLGIPLIEVSTAPDIRTPEEAARVALRIGSLLRATRRVKRGLGTIREDLNVSIREGARTETKGVQELGMIATFVETEAHRQATLAAAARELRERGARVGDTADLTELFSATASQVVSSAIAKGGRVLGTALPGFAGALKEKLGPELAAHARIAGVGGLFHSDELPAYGITAKEVETVRARWGLREADAFLLVADEEGRAREALALAGNRAVAALRGVPEETREPRPDGSTTYARPLPGHARMYPETDVPPIRVTPEWIERVRARLPELPEARVERFVAAHGIHRQLAAQLVDEGSDDRFESLVQAGAEPRTTAAVLAYDLAALRREGVPVDALPEAAFAEVFSLHRQGRFAKEAIPPLLRKMATDRISAGEAAAALGLAGLGRGEVVREIDALLESKRDLVAARGEAAAGPLMGLAMERLRGRADGKLVSEVLRERLRAATGRGK